MVRALVFAFLVILAGTPVMCGIDAAWPCTRMTTNLSPIPRPNGHRTAASTPHFPASPGARRHPPPLCEYLRVRSHLVPTASHENLAGFEDHPLPAIVTKAQEDQRCRQALVRLGYFKVRSAYARHGREQKEAFEALMHESLLPTMDFVRDWLREERNRIVTRARWPFIVTMLATVVAGFAFAAISAVLGQ
jgi:hypothetical protein